MSGIAGILYHGAEFPLIKGFSIAAGNAQFEENIARRIERHAKSNQGENWSQNEETENRSSDIQPTLDRELKFTRQFAHSGHLRVASALRRPGLISPRKEARLRGYRD